MAFLRTGIQFYLVWSNIIAYTSGQNCYAPPTVLYSSISPIKSSYPVGNVVTYTCDAYHTLSGNSQTTCINTSGVRQWNRAPPTCTKYDCTSVTPTAVANANHQWSPPYAGGDKIKYTCNTNYVISGNTEVMCGAGSVWTGSLPTCTRLCPPPDPITNGYVTNPADIYYPAVYARFRCNANNAMTGVPYQVCGTDYTWQGAAPTCTSKAQSQQTFVKDTRVYADQYGGAAGIVSNSQVNISGVAHGTNVTTNMTNEESGSTTGSSDWIILLVVLAILLALLLLALLMFCLMKLCCCGDWCNLCGPGSSGSRCGACCTSCFGQGQMAGFDESETGTGCCGCCKKKKKKQTPKGYPHKEYPHQDYPHKDYPTEHPPGQTYPHPLQTEQFVQERHTVHQVPPAPHDPRIVEKTHFQLAIERVMGNSQKRKQPKKVEGKWMPHSHQVRNNFTSTK